MRESLEHELIMTLTLERLLVEDALRMLEMEITDATDDRGDGGYK